MYKMGQSRPKLELGVSGETTVTINPLQHFGMGLHFENKTLGFHFSGGLSLCLKTLERWQRIQRNTILRFFYRFICKDVHLETCKRPNIEGETRSSSVHDMHRTNIWSPQCHTITRFSVYFNKPSNPFLVIVSAVKSLFYAVVFRFL